MLSAPIAARCAAFMLAAAPLASATLAAQAPAATVHVIVTSAETGDPLPGTQVLLASAGVAGTTDAKGEVRLSSVTPGIHRIEARRPGYAARSEVLTLAAGATPLIRIALPLQTIALAPLEVKARASHGKEMLRSAGFFRRQEAGFGAFVTRAEIEELRTRRLSDAIRRVPGIRLASTAFSDQKASMARSTGTRCPIQYFVNGVPVHGFNIDDVGVQDVEGLEIYRGASELPPEFNRGSAMCGVIVIWTRVD